MYYSDQYQAYTQSNLVGNNPVDLVVALYEAAIESARHAYSCFETGDIMGRSNAVTRTNQILVELLLSVDAEKGGEIAQNLKRLYCYMQRRMLEGHAQKLGERFLEVEKLLNNLLEAWKVVAARPVETPAATNYEINVSSAYASTPEVEEVTMPVYGGYGFDASAGYSRMAFTA